jgi:uncharacterized protein (TIGR03437 family)
MKRQWKAIVIQVAWGLCHVCLAQAPVTILEIETQAKVTYFDDVDYSKLASDPASTKPVAAPNPNKPFAQWFDISDIVAVNGKPVKGTWINAGLPTLNLRPDAAPGLRQSIGDITRTAMVHHYLEIIQTDGTPIGTIMATGFNFGAPPPGVPASIMRDNVTITGGTGAFLGARGQAGNSVTVLNARTASVTEDPANRRVNGGGGTVRFVVYLIPMTRPEIVATASGPAVVHADDYSLVTAAKPAKAGEVLTLFASGLGPTRPAPEPGQPFGANPPAVVNSPVEVVVNGTSGEVLYAGGYPGAVDGYQVNFRIPAGISSGLASLHLTSAWIVGGEVKVPIQ